MKIKLAVIAGLVALGVGQIIVAEMMPTEQQLQPPPWLKLKAMETIRPPPWLIYKGTEDASEAPSAYWTLRVEIDAYVISNPNEHMWVCTGSFTPGPGCSMYSPPDNLQQCGSWFEPVVQLFSNSSGSCSTLGQPFIETLWIGTTASNAQHVGHPRRRQLRRLHPRRHLQRHRLQPLPQRQRQRQRRVVRPATIGVSPLHHQTAARTAIGLAPNAVLTDGPVTNAGTPTGSYTILAAATTPLGVGNVGEP